MEAPDIKVYGWLNKALESLERKRPDAPWLSEIIGPIARDAKPFSLPPYTMSDPPYRGYLFESEPAVTNLEEYHQPFPVIALQFLILDDRDKTRRQPTVAIISHDEEEQQLLVLQAVKRRDRSDWSWYSAGLNVRVNGPLELNRLAIFPHNFGNQPLSHDITQWLVNALNPAVMAAYELAVLLQCQNISIVKVEPPTQANEKRKRKGKTTPSKRLRHPCS